MKKALATTIVALAAALSANALTIGVDAGLNITNDGTNLLDFVPQIANQSPTTVHDWLTPGGTYDPGQIEQYNTIAGASLPQPVGLPGSPAYQAETAADNGNYLFDIGTYYVAAHFGGFNAVWHLVVTDPNVAYGIIADINGTGGSENGGGGYSNFRAWKTDSGTTRVPDSGATLAFLGLAISAVAIANRRRR